MCSRGSLARGAERSDPDVRGAVGDQHDRPGGRLPATLGTRRARAARSGSPRRPRCRRSSAAAGGARSPLARGWWSATGAAVGVRANASRPTWTVLGTPARKCLAARCEARSREGATSVACIELLTSSASMIAPSVTGSATLRCGRAAATIRIASAISKTSIGTCRRQRGCRGATDAVSAGATNFDAARLRRRCWPAYHLTSSGIASSPRRTRGWRSSWVAGRLGPERHLCGVHERSALELDLHRVTRVKARERERDDALRRDRRVADLRDQISWLEPGRVGRAARHDVCTSAPPPAAAKLVVSTPSHAAPVAFGAGSATLAVGPLPARSNRCPAPTAKAATALSRAASAISEARVGRHARFWRVWLSRPRARRRASWNRARASAAADARASGPWGLFRG